jgi:hypothetical protein
MFFSSIVFQMSRNHKEMPPFWRVQELLQLSDKYPSGLEWRIKKACNPAGSQAGRLNKVSGYYMVCIDNVVYLAHRVVYYLRTGTDPINMDIVHKYSNKDKDNRKELQTNKKYAKKEKIKNVYPQALFP